MQTAGRSCDACGARLEVLGDGDGCAACDVVLCNECLAETERCPSCQRPFDETRASRPVASADASQGARQLRAVAVTLLGSIILLNLLGTGAPLTAVALQLVIVGVLLFWTSRGRTLSRWVLVALVGLAAIGNAVQAFSAPGSWWILSAAIALLYAWCGFVLGFSPKIAAFMREQRLRDA